MSMSSPPQPEAPSSVAATQQEYNKQSVIDNQTANMVNQTDALGNKINYTQTGVGANGIPIYAENTTYGPQVQGLINQLMGTKGTAGAQAQGLLQGANYGGQNPSDVIGGMTSGTTQDLLNKEVSYLHPYQVMAENEQDTKLRNQGLLPGMPAYDNAMMQLRNSQGNTITGFLAQAEPAAYQQATSSYTLPATLASNLLGLSAPPSPSFTQTPQFTEQPANYQGAVANYNQAQMQAYQAQVQQQQAMMSGMFGIPTAVLGGWARSGGLAGLGGAAGAGGGLDGAGLAEALASFALV